LGFAEVYKYMLHFPFRVPQFPSEEESRCYWWIRYVAMLMCKWISCVHW
jgi:hypothetical protein